MKIADKSKEAKNSGRCVCTCTTQLHPHGLRQLQAQTWESLLRTSTVSARLTIPTRAQALAPYQWRKHDPPHKHKYLEPNKRQPLLSNTTHQIHTRSPRHKDYGFIWKVTLIPLLVGWQCTNRAGGTIKNLHILNRQRYIRMYWPRIDTLGSYNY